MVYQAVSMIDKKMLHIVREAERGRAKDCSSL